jgi:4-amino-4-deoxychorismate lyase
VSAALPQRPELVRVNGEETAALAALDRGLHYGDGLFETIACVGGVPRLIGLHLKRLAGGCGRLQLTADLAALEREVHELARPTARSVLKVIVTRGPALARGYGTSGAEKPTRITLCYAWPAEDPALAREGVRVRVAQLRLGENPALAGLKHLNRLEQVLARAEWREAEIAEALMFSSGGALISGTMSNVFLVHGGALRTPRLDRCGVAGVMREAVLQAASAAGIGAEERVFNAQDLASAEEIFLTNALIGIRPVRELAGRTLPAGPLTRRLQELLAPLLAAPGGVAGRNG